MILLGDSSSARPGPAIFVPGPKVHPCPSGWVYLDNPAPDEKPQRSLRHTVFLGNFLQHFCPPSAHRTNACPESHKFEKITNKLSVKNLTLTVSGTGFCIFPDSAESSFLAFFVQTKRFNLPFSNDFLLQTVQTVHWDPQVPGGQLRVPPGLPAGNRGTKSNAFVFKDLFGRGLLKKPCPPHHNPPCHEIIQ